MVEFESICKLVGFVFIGYLLFKLIKNVIYICRVFVWSQIFPERNLKTKYGQWAVVTGSTDGIGKAYAIELANKGLDILLISRNLRKLEKVSKEIGDLSSNKVRIEILQVDFAEGRPVYDNIKKELLNKEVGILVNNVGVCQYPKYYPELDEQEIWDHINVNVGAVSIMTWLVLPGMIKRRRGAIINMSSTASTGPSPCMALYSATKSYVDYISLAVQKECEQHNVDVLNLNPSYVATNMTKYSKLFEKTSIATPSPETYAKSSLKTLGRTKETCGYWFHSFQRWLYRLLPRSAFIHFNFIWQRKLRREAPKCN